MGENEHPPDGVTNPEVGKRLGLSYSAISRIRSGSRYPSVAIMRKIRDVYGWPIQDQVALIPEAGHNTAYSEEFERRINQGNKPTTTK